MKNMNSKSEEDKLVELKEMLIGRWILENRSVDDLMKYEKRYDEEWIRREGLMILQTEEMVDLMVDKSEDEVWNIFYYLIRPYSVSSSVVQCSLVLLCNWVSDRMGGGGDGWKRLRVMCWVVERMNEPELEWIDETIDYVVNYLEKVIEECEEMEMVKWAILTGEKWWVKMKMSSKGRDRLRTALTRHSQTHSDTLVGQMDRLDLWDAERYQVGWCARWCVDNVFEVGVEKIPRVKLSRDLFEARFDDRNHSPVRSQFPVKSNVYFYEVICVTNGEIKVGWWTRQARMNLFGDGKNSVMLQVGNQCAIDHNNHRHPIPNPPTPYPLNVFGCLLDVDNRRFDFYLNGRALDCPITAHFSPPYFATVHLSPHQQCHFNFGQCPFKFPPRNIRFTTFHEQTEGDERKYRLVGTEKNFGEFWFAHPPVDNQVSLLFDDEMQNEVNREVRRVEGDIENDRIGKWKRNREINEGLKWLRYIQAIIEVMGNVVRVDKVDVMAQWVGQVIEDVIDKVHQYKLLELLYPYLHLVITQSTLTQHRSICIVLLHLIKCCRYLTYKFIKPLHSSVFTYLTRTLTSSPDHWTQLFVLIALADLEMSETEKRQIEGCAKIGQIVETCRETFEEKDVGQLIKSGHESRLQYQLYLCSQRLINSINPNRTNPNLTTSATLNPHDLTPQLTLSPCHLSARSDWHWQSVRSVCQVSAHIYYFEVVLLTAGPMTIGWATSRTDLTRTEVGRDKFSIGFNGFNRCIHHNARKYRTVDSNLSFNQLNHYLFPLRHLFQSKQTPPRWKAGDVVGCLLDSTSKRFHFFLNGSLMHYRTNVYFSNHLSYHACVSLSPHQQVYFNFGQTSFQYPPKNIDYLDFTIQIQTSKQNAPLPTIGSITQSIVTIDSTAHLGNTTISSVQSITPHESTKPVNSSEPSNASQCYLCKKSTPHANSRLRFDCCDHMRICLDCAPLIRKCPIHK